MSNKGSIFHLAKSDTLLQSKHADAAFQGRAGPGWALFWYDTPRKGKCTCVEYNPENWPAVYVTVKANWKAKRDIASYRRDCDWSEGVF
jgi:predicted lipoprotein with Yx(FWY)xxD motif